MSGAIFRLPCNAVFSSRLLVNEIPRKILQFTRVFSTIENTQESVPVEAKQAVSATTALKLKQPKPRKTTTAKKQKAGPPAGDASSVSCTSPVMPPTVETSIQEEESLAKYVKEIIERSEASRMLKEKEAIAKHKANLKARVPCMSLYMYGYDKNLLSTYLEFCRRSALYFGLEIGELQTSGSMPVISSSRKPPRLLKYHIEKWGVLKSPHVDKKHWSQFERRTQRAHLEIFNADRKILDRLFWYLEHHLPSEVWFHATQSTYEVASV